MRKFVLAALAALPVMILGHEMVQAGGCCGSGGCGDCCSKTFRLGFSIGIAGKGWCGCANDCCPPCGPAPYGPPPGYGPGPMGGYGGPDYMGAPAGGYMGGYPGGYQGPTGYPGSNQAPSGTPAPSGTAAPSAPGVVPASWNGPGAAPAAPYGAPAPTYPGPYPYGLPGPMSGPGCGQPVGPCCSGCNNGCGWVPPVNCGNCCGPKGPKCGPCKGCNEWGWGNCHGNCNSCGSQCAYAAPWYLYWPMDAHFQSPAPTGYPFWPAMTANMGYSAPMTDPAPPTVGPPPAGAMAPGGRPNAPLAGYPGAPALGYMYPSPGAW